MNKSFKNSVFIGVGIILTSIVLFLVLSTVLSNGMAETTASIVTKKIQIAGRAELLGNLAEIKAKSTEAAVLKQKMDSLLSTQEQLLSVPQYLSGLANVYKISLSFAFKANPTLPQGTTPGFSLYSADASGSLDNLGLFLSNIEADATKYVISIEGFDISSAGPDNYRITFQGKVFFR